MEKYVDVRRRGVVELLDECAECKKEYVLRFHIRHACSECRMRAMKKHLSSWDSMWKYFDRAMEELTSVFRKVK